MIRMINCEGTVLLCHFGSVRLALEMAPDSPPFGAAKQGTSYS